MFIDHGNDIFGKSSAQYLQAKFLFPVIGDANMWGFSFHKYTMVENHAFPFKQIS